jgi:regulator of nonsense transcripts 1
MLAQKIQLTGLRVVRFCSKSRESVSSDAEELTLHYQLRHYSGPSESKLKSYFALIDDQKHLSAKDESDFKSLKNKIET